MIDLYTAIAKFVIIFFGLMGITYSIILMDEWSKSRIKKKEKSDIILAEIQEVKRQLGNELYQSKKSLESERRRWRANNDI
jgi:hypothetical protein|tara:strand:+ start:74 stop:316 length:243 start_codon:yes stop_codon:yes gene_type:complete